VEADDADVDPWGFCPLCQIANSADAPEPPRRFSRKRKAKKRDSLFMPRLVFLLLFAASAAIGERTGSIIFLCCFLATGIASLAIRAAKED
jgi:hypothetical protein